ncbi:hypothetical protein Tco_0797151 [Tanacetum coccineum]
MSQPANDDYSQHLSDDEASYHEDASENGTTTNKPKQQQQQLIPTTTTISNIKLPILKKEEYDIWAMEMEHYLEYIDNDVWKFKSRFSKSKNVPQEVETVTTSLNELDILFSPMFDEYFNGATIVVSNTTVHEVREPSSRHVDPSNMHTFCQINPSKKQWTKDHSLEEVIKNPSQPVRTRRQLETDGEMCMFALTVSRTEPKNIKDAMVDSAWIEAMHEELRQFK